MNISRVYAAIHYALGLFLLLSAPGSITLKVMLALLYSTIVPVLFMAFNKNGNAGMLFLSYFTLVVYPLFAVLLYFLNSGYGIKSLSSLALASFLSVSAYLAYREESKAATEENVMDKGEPELPAQAEVDVNIEDAIIGIRNAINNEKEKNEKIRERIREIREKINSMQ
jgi:flagellar biosynthesis component FlhA